MYPIGLRPLNSKIYTRSTQEPGSGSRYLYAGCRPRGKQVPLGLILETLKPSILDIIQYISTPQK